MISPTLPLNENLESIRKALAGTIQGKWEATKFGDTKSTSLYCEGVPHSIGSIKRTEDATWIAASKDVCGYLLDLVEFYRNGWAESLCEYDKKHNGAVMQQGKYHEAIDAEVQKRLEGTKP